MLLSEFDESDRASDSTASNESALKEMFNKIKNGNHTNIAIDDHQQMKR